MERISTRLQGIFNELELIDDPRRDPIRVVLQACISDVVGMEVNFGFPDLVKQNERLKAELEAYKLVKEDELDAHKAESSEQISTLAKRLAEFSSKKPEEKKRCEEPSSDGIVILGKLNTAGKPFLTIEEIAHLCVMSEPNVAVALNGLKDGGWIETNYEYQTGNTFRRNVKGDEYILSMWAKDKSTLDSLAERILLLIGRAKERTMSEGDIFVTMHGVYPAISMDEVVRILSRLGSDGHVGRGATEIDLTTGYLWELKARGEIYLRRRGMLPEIDEPTPVTPEGKNKTLTKAQWSILKLLDERGETTAAKFAELTGVTVQIAEGQLNDLQADNNRIVFAQWRGPDYVFSLGEEGKKLVAEQHASGLSDKRKAGSDLSAVEVKILLFLRTPGGGDGRMTHDVARHAGVDPQLAEVHLSRLLQAGLASQHVNIHKAGCDWHRTIGGSEYLATRGLL